MKLGTLMHITPVALLGIIFSMFRLSLQDVATKSISTPNSILMTEFIVVLIYVELSLQS
jgi:hypothetical protein